MNRIRFPAYEAILLVVLISGCTIEGPLKVNWIQIAHPERTTPCILLNTAFENKLSFENSKSKPLDRDRLEVYAEIRNRTSEMLEIKISTAFRNETGQVVDTSVWKTYLLHPNQTLAYTISSVVRAETFTIRIK